MFDQIFDAIEEWMRGLLTGIIHSNLDRMFTDVNEKTVRSPFRLDRPRRAGTAAYSI